MAETCPRKECMQKEPIEGIKKTLYGSDGTTGVVGYTKKCVTRAQAWAWLVAVVIPIGLPMTLLAVSLYAKTDEKIRVLEIQMAVENANITSTATELRKAVELLGCSLKEAEKDRRELYKMAEELKRELVRFNGYKRGVDEE